MIIAMIKMIVMITDVKKTKCLKAKPIKWTLLLFSSSGGQTGQLGRKTDRKCSNLRSCSARPRRSGQTNANKDRTGVTQMLRRFFNTAAEQDEWMSQFGPLVLIPPPGSSHQGHSSCSRGTFFFFFVFVLPPPKRWWMSGRFRKIMLC